MAQRFAIDGNFTQSFVGTVKLNASACPANVDDFASLYYDLDTGTVCYVTASTDFCYEFLFDTERTIPVGKSSNARQADPPARSFQFVGAGGAVGDRSTPHTNLLNTDFLMFDSESVNAGNLINYLIQNTTSGSLKLSTTTQAVQADYTSQTQTGSFGDNKVILGNANNIPTGSNPTFTIITKTSNTPFTQGEKVCVEIIKAGGGGTATTYQTGSSEVKTDLNNLIVKDYDSNVTVISDPITGQLTLQFGTPQEPTTLLLAPSPSNPFNDDRFNKQFDTYAMRFQYNLNGTTFVSASLIDTTGGGSKIVRTENTDPGGSITFTQFANPDAQSTGSRTFQASLRVTLADNSEQNFTVNDILNLDKDDPGVPSITTVVSNGVQGGVSQTNTATTSTILIHIGATGSITRDSGSGTSNGWTFDGGDGTNSSGNLTFNYVSATNEPSATVRNFWKSPTNANDPDIFYTSSRSVSNDRKFVWKFGAAATASLLEGDTLDLKYLQDLGFESSSNSSGFDEDPVGESFTIQGNSFDYHYLIVKDNEVTSTPVITVNNQQVTFPEVAHYQNIQGSIGYRVFRTGQQGSSAVEYTLTTG